MNRKPILATLFLVWVFSAVSSAAQTTGFTYQGKLASNTGNPLSGQYDFQFKLFDTDGTGLPGTQQGTTQTATNITVTNGIFTVQLDFGACASCFNGSPRFLEIAVKLSGSGSYTTLAPRQPITSTPYAIKTQNLTFNGAFNNGTTIFTATNTFAGDGAGVNTTPDPSLPNVNGKFNSFYGAGAGKLNTTGTQNAFFGYQAGQANTSGFDNAFFGYQAGQNNINNDNSFFGWQTGLSNTTGGANAFFGSQAGSSNTSGRENIFIGINTGSINTVGSDNTFIGAAANFSPGNPTGDYNTLLGALSTVNSGVSFSTAIGARALVSQSNSLVLGGISGVNGGNDTKVGIGTTAPGYKLEILDPGSTGLRVQNNTTGGTVASFGSNGVFNIDAPFLPGGRFTVLENGNVGIGVPTPLDLLDVGGPVRLRSLASGNTTTLCRNASNQISNCSSSIRYKTNVAKLSSSLSLINQLRPVTFTWKASNEPDVGLIAEEVEQVAPLLTFRNENGDIEGVKYDRVGVVLINAIKEQQVQI
jgi:hypothetical protein